VEFKNYKEKILNGKDAEWVFHSMYEKLGEWDIMEDTTPKFIEMWRIVIKAYEALKKEVDNLTETNYEYSRTIDRMGHAHAEMYYENEALKKELEKIKELYSGGEIIA